MQQIKPSATMKATLKGSIVNSFIKEINVTNLRFDGLSGSFIDDGCFPVNRERVPVVVQNRTDVVF